MVEPGYIVVLVTTESYDEAKKIAEALVSQRKAACTNIVPKIDSLFWWKGKVEEAGESLLLIKTRAELFPAIVDLVKEIHSYEVPEIIALPVVEGNADYLAWISKETGMGRQVKVTVGRLELTAWLNETNTAAKVLEILPVTSQANVWGDEIYFPIPLDTGEEEAKEIVDLGDIAYWPQGKAICIFFGRTPVSRRDEIRPISPVNVIGRIQGDPKVLKQVKQGDKVTIERS